MPPRRSARAASASLEAPPAESGPAKRKRGQITEAEADEKENVAKPPSKTRRASTSRSSAAPVSKSRSSARGKTSLPDVAESDNEEHSDAPPPKKARPSPETRVKEEDGEEEEDLQEQPKRTRRGASAKPSAAIKVNEVGTSRASGRRSKQVASSGSRVSAGSAAQTEEMAEDKDEEAEEDIKPTRTRRSGSKRTTSRAVESDEDEDVQVSDDEEEEEKPARKGRKSKAKPQATRKTKAPSKKPIKAPIEVEESDEDLEPPTPGQPKSKPSGLEATPAAPEVEQEEEEKSLFDPPPMPAPSTLPQEMPEEPIGPKSRLVIHKMALVNFKSYAGRQEIGPFHKSFSAIVGPNGSGKSNTIDALLFVFGYRASKMRQGKISELIHNSANHPDLQECTVEVHFREIVDLPGPDAYKVVPKSQLVVARTAYKNNSSKYTINGKGKTYSEVQSLLKGKGIDLDHNRFLILQGEVESIAQMKPKAPTEHEDGLLEYLEDIIGTSKYKEPIDEAMVEVERLQDERQIKMNRLRHVEKEKLALEASKREAEDYIRLSNEYVRAQSRHLQWLLWKLFDKEQDIEHKIKKYTAELEKETKEHSNDIKHLEDLRKHYEDREKTYEVVQKAAVVLSKDLKEVERKEIGLQEKRKHSGGKLKKLKKTDTAALKAAAQTLKESTAKIEKEKQNLEDHEASLEDEQKVLEDIRDGLKDKTQVFHDKIQEKQKELEPWTAKINDEQAKLDVATSERDSLAKKAEALKTQMKEATETLQTLQVDLDGKSEDQEKMRSEKSQLQRRVQDAEKRLKTAQDAAQQWTGKARSTRSRVDEAKANQSEKRSQNNVLESLNRLKEAGNNEGFHGRLGNLGTIPDQYDVAISTACGGGLNNMVVNQVTQAQACIEYLRKNSIGRASFMVLEKLSSSGMDKVTTPEGVPRLFDLVKPKDDMFKPAFFKAIGQTLVAKDLEQANRIAFGGQKRWRVVTLDGGLIETSGAMSGGGSTPSRGAMSSKLAAATVSPQTLQIYERESEDAAKQLQQATAELKDAEQELDRCRERGPQIDLSYQKLCMEIENTKRRITEAEKRVKELSAQNKPNTGDLARITKLDREITVYESELEKLRSKTGRIEDEIKKLEGKILEIGGSKLLAQKSKVEGIRLHIKLTNEEITKAEVAKAKAAKDSTKLETALATNNTAMEELGVEVEELDGELEELAGRIAEITKKCEEAQTAAENSKEDLENLKAKLDEKEEEISEFRQREMKLKQAINDAGQQKKEAERLIQEYEQKHDQLTLEEIDDDDDDDDEGMDEAAAPTETMDEDPLAENVKPEGEVKAEPNRDSGKQKQKAPLNELPILEVEELKKYRKEELTAEMAALEEQLARSKPDMSVLKEYKQREQEFLNRAQDLDNITAQRDAQKAKYDGLRKQRLDEFMAGFNLISLKLKEMYQMITLGGNAELELVDSMDPFSEGIIFSVMPPKKSWKNISNLSGGEKTLSSLALVFALHVFKPTPLYFMDEIDAALDFRNVSIVANYIKDRTKNAQFIIISLRNDMFELSHRLIGIYKTSNQTRSISIDNHALQSTIPIAPTTQVPA